MLYFGDNSPRLKQHIPGESVDLISLDPPINSTATYNVLFQGKSGLAASAQFKANVGSKVPLPEAPRDRSHQPWGRDRMAGFVLGSGQIRQARVGYLANLEMG
jgi:hypothetical protein